jgi:hypothetical protein
MAAAQSPQENVTLSREDFDRLLRAVQQGGQQQTQSSSQDKMAETVAALLEESKRKDQLIASQQAQIAHQNQHLDAVTERENLVVDLTSAELHLGSISGSAEVVIRRSKDNTPVSGLALKFYTSLLGSRQLVANAVTDFEGVAKATGVLHSASSLGGAFGGYTCVFDGDLHYKPFERQMPSNITSLATIL